MDKREKNFPLQGGGIIIFDNACFFKYAIKLVKSSNWESKISGEEECKEKNVRWIVEFRIFFGYSHAGFAENYPNKSIRLIVPFAAGEANNLVARALQKSPGKELKTAIVVENIPGGSTKMGTMELFKSDPDGYPLMLAGHAALMSDYYSVTYDEKVWGKMTIMGKIGFLE